MVRKTDYTQKKCDLCNIDGSLFGEIENYQILRCKKCNLLWTNPLKYESRIDEPKVAYWGEKIYRSQAKRQKKRFRKQLRKIIELANNNELPTLLEVGSGLGFFLEVCRELDIQAEGCDISQRAHEIAVRKDLKVNYGTLDNSYKNQSFDIICAFNLIEHLDYPSLFLNQSKRILKKKGFLVLETPIKESLAQQIAEIGFKLTKGNLNFLGLIPGGHRYLFSKRTFDVICHNFGFTNRYQKNISSPFFEVWDKSSLISLNFSFIYKFALPIIWALSAVLQYGNRLFVILQKM